MAKRPQSPTNRGRAPAHLTKLIDKDASKGLSNRLVDRAFWLGDRTDLDDWIMALEAIDKRGDKTPLLALLRSKRKLLDKVRSYLADLIDRYQFVKKRGGKLTPEYNRTENNAILELGIIQVKGLVKRGKRVKDALEEISESLGVQLSTLESAHSGKHTSFRRRIKKRSRPL